MLTKQSFGIWKISDNQSVENAGVTFFNGADKKFFEKNKQSVMYDEQMQANKAKTNNLRVELIWGMNSGHRVLLYK